jgi:hypothetical protein
MDHPFLSAARVEPQLTRSAYRLVFLAQVGFVAVSLCLAVIGGYFTGTVPFQKALALFVLGGAVATLSWRYVFTRVRQLDRDEEQARASTREVAREPGFSSVR